MFSSQARLQGHMHGTHKEQGAEGTVRHPRPRNTTPRRTTTKSSLTRTVADSRGSCIRPCGAASSTAVLATHFQNPRREPYRSPLRAGTPGRSINVPPLPRQARQPETMSAADASPPRSFNATRTPPLLSCAFRYVFPRTWPTNSHIT